MTRRKSKLMINRVMLHHQVAATPFQEVDMTVLKTNSAQHISVSLENERDLNNKSLNKPSEIAGRDNLILMNDLMDIQGRKHKQNETTEYDIDSSQLMHQISVNDLAIVPHVPGSQPMFEEPDSGSDDLEQKKKMKTEENFPMELSAVAGFQPRREQ
jgi:hypothetical protein